MRPEAGIQSYIFLMHNYNASIVVGWSGFSKYIQGKTFAFKTN
jgi:hypothetical protein